MMKMMLNARTMFAAAALFAFPVTAMADFTKTNPVTGEIKGL